MKTQIVTLISTLANNEYMMKNGRYEMQFKSHINGDVDVHKFCKILVTLIYENPNYLPSEVATDAEVFKVCREPLIDITQTQCLIG